MIHGLDLSDTQRAPLARLNSGGLPINAGQMNRVWRGMVQVPGSFEPSVPVAIKWMPGQAKLPIELACSLAGAELRLKVPRGVLVLATRDQLPGLPAGAKPLPGTDDYLCFGSMHQWPDDSAARALDDASSREHTWRQLCELPSAAPAAAWDELTANGDRHTGNLLFDGEDYWLIDHDLALEPFAQVMRRWAVQSARQRILEHRARANEVAEQLCRRHPNDHAIHAQPTRFTKVEHRLNQLADQMRSWNTGNPGVDGVWPLAEVALRGITLRLAPLAQMLNQRLNIPDPKSLWSSSPNPPPEAPR